MLKRIFNNLRDVTSLIVVTNNIVLRYINRISLMEGIRLTDILSIEIYKE